MVIDKYGFPMDFEVFSGNTSEFKSMRPVITAWKKRYQIKEAVVFADRGINSAENLEMLRSLDFGFLVAQKVTQFSREMEKKLFEEDQYQPINPANPDAGRFRVIPDWTKGTGDKAGKCTLVLTWNEKRARLDNNTLDALVRLIQAKQARGEKIGKSRSAWAQLVKTEKDVEARIIGVDEKALARRRRFAGYAALVYSAAGPQGNAEGTTSEAQEAGAYADGNRMEFPMAGTYKKLTEIETCFRIMKSNLGLRPMYVWTSEHIRGHILVIFLALLLVRIVQDRLKKSKAGLSIDEICEGLRDCEVAAVYNPAADSYLYLPTARRETNRKAAPWDSNQHLRARHETGELEIKDNGDTIMQACGLSPVPTLCSRAELARCLGTRFPTDADIGAFFLLSNSQNREFLSALQLLSGSLRNGASDGAASCDLLRGRLLDLRPHRSLDARRAHSAHLHLPHDCLRGARREGLRRARNAASLPLRLRDALLYGRRQLLTLGADQGCG